MCYSSYRAYSLHHTQIMNCSGKVSYFLLFCNRGVINITCVCSKNLRTVKSTECFWEGDTSNFTLHKKGPTGWGDRQLQALGLSLISSPKYSGGHSSYAGSIRFSSCRHQPILHTHADPLYLLGETLCGATMWVPDMEPPRFNTTETPIQSSNSLMHA